MGTSMKAMVLVEQGRPLVMREMPRPVPGPHQLLVRVLTCGVCRTDLHIVDGDLTEPTLPLVPGHQIVATVESIGEGVRLLASDQIGGGVTIGDRVGIPWLGGTCGSCSYCNNGSENLCNSAVFTGYQVNGGFAEYAVADARFCFPVPDMFSDAQAAPLLCAGLIGYRSLRMAEPAMSVGDRKARLGLYGFGAAAHISAQIAIFGGADVYGFVRPGDQRATDFARRLGAVWAGPSTEKPPDELDAAIIFAPVGALVPVSLRAIRKGGRVVCGGIHMSDIPSFSYDLLWGERSICSVTNLTRMDGVEFFKAASQIPVETTVTEFDIEDANHALNQLRSGQIDGAAVLRIRHR